MNESENQERVELHKRETVVFKEQFQILPIVTGGLKALRFESLLNSLAVIF